MTSIQRTAPESYLVFLLYKSKCRYLETYKRYSSIKEPTGKDRVDLYTEGCNVIMVSASLIEASANLFLSMKCDKRLFEALERTELEKKWTELPKLFYDDWSIPNGNSTSNTLKALVKARNYIVHTKPEVTIDGILIHKGNHPKVECMQHKFILKYFDLPTELMKLLASKDTSFNMDYFDFRDIMDGTK